MGVVAALTADVRDLSLWTVIVTNSQIVIDVSSTTARTGTYSYFLNNKSGSVSNGSLAKGVTPRIDYYFRVAFYIDSVDSSTGAFKLYIRDGIIENVYINIAPSAGNIKVYRSATLLGTSSGVTISGNTWYCLEGYVKVHNTTGQVTLKIDGTQVLNLTNIDTDNGSTGNIDNFLFYSYNNPRDVYYIDDIVIRDDAWPGTGGLYVIIPNADGSVDNWTASAGNQYECVDDNPANDFTDYISTNAVTTGTKQLFGHVGLPDVTYVSIQFVSVVAKGKLTGSGAGNIRPIILNSGTYGNGTTVGLGPVTARWAQSVFTVNPDGGDAWTEAEVNATEFGVETI